MKYSKLRMIIVDDNSDFRDILWSYLSSFDEFEPVGAAGNGLDALTLIEEKEPDLVIMDVVMPRLDGLGVLESIKKRPLRKTPRFIILSAVGQDKIIQIALSLGAEFYMIKPCDLEDLVARIHQLWDYDSYNGINLSIKNERKTEETEKSELTIDDKITQLLDMIEIPRHLKGYDYLKHAILMVEEDLTTINSLTKVIYVNIAEKFRTTSSRVEKALRNAIDIAYRRGNMGCIHSPSAKKLEQRPTNSEFIIMLVDHFRAKSD
ncbi:MAG: sporulation transcription factor Spo0A [Clostridiales bacterium 43-6]|mgnify:CR=1 FL=1|nr:MAG: sporulation transcription factor Spo0A [Clostridiales bacterium 43-6]